MTNELFKDIVILVDKYNRQTIDNARLKARDMTVSGLRYNPAEHAYYVSIEDICERLITMREVLHSDFPEDGVLLD